MGHIFEKEIHSALQTVIDNLIDGLVYDGGHHKQHCLEKALQNLMLIMGDDDSHDFKQIKEQLQWEEGIPA